MGGADYLRITHPFATEVRRLPFDLHVLGTPPAFVLSQDQTLRLKPASINVSHKMYCSVFKERLVSNDLHMIIAQSSFVNTFSKKNFSEPDHSIRNVEQIRDHEQFRVGFAQNFKSAFVVELQGNVIRFLHR